jgi:hypothetical protein
VKIDYRDRPQADYKSCQVDKEAKEFFPGETVHTLKLLFRLPLLSLLITNFDKKMSVLILPQRFLIHK